MNDVVLKYLKIRDIIQFQLIIIIGLNYGKIGGEMK